MIPPGSFPPPPRSHSAPPVPPPAPRVAPTVVEVIVQRISPKPGEVVVLTFPGPLSLDQATVIQRQWRESMPDFPCVVMCDGGHVTGVLSPRDLARRKKQWVSDHEYVLLGDEGDAA